MRDTVTLCILFSYTEQEPNTLTKQADTDTASEQNLDICPWGDVLVYDTQLIPSDHVVCSSCGYDSDRTIDKSVESALS
jgi:hypothetical protein